MAFGRDGSESAINKLDIQNRIYLEALEKIFEKSKEEKTRKIAKDAIKKAGKIEF